MGTHKIGPALAAARTSVVEPAEQPRCRGWPWRRSLRKRACPGGVVNVITTARPRAVMAPPIADPRTRKVSFTGSTEVGRQFVQQGAEQVLRMSMELGQRAVLDLRGCSAGEDAYWGRGLHER
jgi:succinate-semialdehyde dehydrogenase/glutarate-semialdehyde dehydrogenase